ncbi:MAG: hypothetical protein KDB00_10450 [Planctomycetales bacterium]|nr:hypothetical protein [Planctomycetales bacterium]
MSVDDNQFAWWSRLRHSGLLLSPVVQIEKYSEEPEPSQWYAPDKIRNAYTKFNASIDRSSGRPQMASGDVLAWVDHVLERFIGHTDQRLARSHNIPESLSALIRIGSRTETLKPDRILMDEDGKTPLLLVKADLSPHVGRGKGRTEYARFLELLRGTGHRLGLLTNGLQFRLIYAGLDFESWCEWEADRWFEDSEGNEELLGLRQLLFPVQQLDAKKQVVGAGLPGLLTAVEESRKRQADLSQVLRENVRRAVEMLLEDVSTASRTDPELFTDLMSSPTAAEDASDKTLSDNEAHEALMQATVRVVMRMVVCLFAESRGLLPTSDLIYSQAYGVRSLYELLDETARHEGSTIGLMGRNSAWPRLMALYRLIHGGSGHGAFTLRAYGGALFRPGAEGEDDPVSRALYVLEHKVMVSDATIYRVLKKLLRGPLPVMKGRSKSYVEGPVDYTDLRTEFIGLIYEGLLDYRIKRTTEEIGPQVFLNLGRQPVLPLSRLEAMLDDKPKSLKDLFAELKKESVSKTVESEDEEEQSEEDETDEEQPAEEEIAVGSDDFDAEARDSSYLDAVKAAERWARKAVIATKLITAQRKRETDTEYDKRIDSAVDSLIDRVVAPGEFYLVRAGNTRKGTGTFYTRPQLAVPTVHRTLQPLCYHKHDDGTLTPKTPEEILSLKVCDPACGSASFLVAALLYLSDALYKSLCHHHSLDDPKVSAKVTLPFGKKRTRNNDEERVPFLPDDPDRGDSFRDWVEARLRRHVVERCIYGVDINPLAVEFARVSLWVETLDDRLPFSFIDHKVKVGNALVGCWLNRFEHYPIAAWERVGGDDPSSKVKGDRTLRLETWLKGEKGPNNRRSGDGIIKQEMRQVISDREIAATKLLAAFDTDVESTVAATREEYERIHELPVGSDPDERKQLYQERIKSSPALTRLTEAMDEWCSIWFWPADEESLKHIPTPATLHRGDENRRRLVRDLKQQLRFFHWEIEFPDVFSAERSGFSAVIGNPPWEVMKPSSMEFFTEHEPLYRSYEKQAALRRQQELFADIDGLEREWDDYNGRFKSMSNFVKNSADPFDVSLARGNANKELHGSWKAQRKKSKGFASGDLPFRYQGSADLNSYKLFLESAHHLLAESGRMGLIVPSGIYTDLGCKNLRELFLNESCWDWLFGFINWEQIFSIYYRFKFVALILSRHKPPADHTVSTAFGRYKISDWEQAEKIAFPLPKSNVVEFSPKTLSILEIATERDLKICRTIYDNSFRIGDQKPGWEVEYAAEFHMTNDSKHFPTIDKWQAKGYAPDRFGRWVNDSGDVALPVYEGRMIDQFDFSQKGYVEGRGRNAVWREIEFDNKTIEPQYLMSAEKYSISDKPLRGPKLAFMDIASSTNARTMKATVGEDFPYGNSAPVLSVAKGNLPKTLYLSAALNSLTFDFATRPRVGGLHLNWFIVEECPVPRVATITDSEKRLIQNATRLTFLHRRFAPQWLTLLREGCVDDEQEWKNWWAVDEADRLRLKVENEVISSGLYGLEPDDFDWMVRTDETNPIGFWRVEQSLPFEERITGLAARGARALKDGKWSAATVGELSNDEFFEILGIPEMTSKKAATAKGLSGPLILKRGGCHSWHPERFTEDDPRYGWTWDHCRADAIALLGSEEAVDDYIARATSDNAISVTTEDEQPFELISEPAVKKKDEQGMLNFDEADT